MFVVAAEAKAAPPNSKRIKSTGNLRLYPPRFLGCTQIYDRIGISMSYIDCIACRSIGSQVKSV